MNPHREQPLLKDGGKKRAPVTTRESLTTGKPKNCSDCRARCCRSVTIEIDTPRSKRDIDEVKWFVLHENTVVYIDYENKWNVEFGTRCTALTDANRCSIYQDRPIICRQYPKKGDVCEYEENPCKTVFRSVASATSYFNRRKRRKKKKPAP